MKVSIIQSDIVWENKLANFRKLEKLISRIKGKTDIIILPEMFSTGFSLNPEQLAEPPHNETFRWMAGLAAEGDSGICGSYIVRSGKKYFNRWVFVSPGGRSRSYDKRHLFRMDGEERAYTRGEKRIVFKFRNARICPNVCYDLRFPVWSRNRNDYDILINSANWPASRKDVWITLLKARAIENQCFVAGANRTGTDGNGIRYSGCSMVINPRGETVAVTDESEGHLTAEISMSELHKERDRFPVHLDSDEFLINN